LKCCAVRVRSVTVGAGVIAVGGRGRRGHALLLLPFMLSTSQ